MKKPYKSIIAIVLICSINLLYSQNEIDKGFKMLEKGQFDLAEQFFETYIENYPNNLTAKLCFGRAVGLNGNPEKALSIFNGLLELQPNNIEFQINKAESFLWLKRYKDGLKLYESIKTLDPDNPVVYMGIANSYSSLNQYSQAITYYKKSLDLDNTILGTKIGLAYTYHANNENKKALNIISEILVQDSNQKNILDLKTKIEKLYKPEVSQDFKLTFDSGDNRNVHLETKFKYPIDTKQELLFRYNYSNFKNDVSLLKANQHTINLGYNINLKNTIKTVFDLGYLVSNSAMSYSDVIFKMGLETKLRYNQNLNIYIAKEYHNFNVDLINLDIAQYNGIVNYHWFSKSRIGVYGQYIYTIQTDDNVRNLGFLSLYYSFNTKQLIKLGFNGNYIAFKEAKPTQYFSPQYYTLGEAFTEVKLRTNNKKFEFGALGAIGIQSFDNNSSQSSYRVESNLTYKTNNHFRAKLYGNHSNIAASNAAGFEFSSIGLNLLYRF